MKKFLSPILVSCLILSVGFSLYLLAKEPKTPTTCKNDQNFISPDIVCDEDPSMRTKSLKTVTETIVRKHIADATVKRLSVFYRDLDNRQWFGVNENEPFAPGSLLKLPLAISYYKLAEIEPSILDHEYEYQKNSGEETLHGVQNIKPSEKLIAGKKYGVRDLLDRMMKYSDNEPVPFLVSLLSKEFLDKVFIDLGVYIPTSRGVEENFISVKTYGSILRALYNASYINREFSNELLEMLGESVFDSGIETGVPNSVRVANKFGERVFVDEASNRVVSIELHDCGIIYDKEAPYILCVMTEGRNFDELSEAIADISKTVYENRD